MNRNTSIFFKKMIPPRLSGRYQEQQSASDTQHQSDAGMPFFAIMRRVVFSLRRLARTSLRLRRDALLRCCLLGLLDMIILNCCADGASARILSTLIIENSKDRCLSAVRCYERTGNDVLSDQNPRELFPFVGRALGMGSVDAITGACRYEPDACSNVAACDSCVLPHSPDETFASIFSRS